MLIYEPAQDKTYNTTCVNSKDSAQPLHSPSMARDPIYPSLDSPEMVEGTGNQQRQWSDCADAQADLSLHWSHKSYYRFCPVLAIIFYFSTKTCCGYSLEAPCQGSSIEYHHYITCTTIPQCALYVASSSRIVSNTSCFAKKFYNRGQKSQCMSSKNGRTICYKNKSTTCGCQCSAAVSFRNI